MNLLKPHAEAIAYHLDQAAKAARQLTIDDATTDPQSPQVGDTICFKYKFDALPIGSVIAERKGTALTKQDFGKWLEGDNWVIDPWGSTHTVLRVGWEA